MVDGATGDDTGEVAAALDRLYDAVDGLNSGLSEVLAAVSKFGEFLDGREATVGGFEDSTGRLCDVVGRRMGNCGQVRLGTRKFMRAPGFVHSGEFVDLDFYRR
jgi:hypothetical protein